MGWYITPPLLAAIFAWWLYGVIMMRDYNEWIVLGCFLMCLMVFVIFALISISQQIQYDWFSKIKSSFKAADWGPVDPISRYYWLARREEIQRGITSDGSRPSRYSRNVLGQLSGTSSVIQLNEIERKSPDWPHFELGYKRRANSDDHVYNEYRKKTVKLSLPNIKPCSVS
ncbi:hypothetical protein EVAR_68618_1 [Eumeta japonica]|uniref:Uncharacterized protein n=1 Tax=Eumeta variegata TaxID=151549 RepID=A0A4C2AEF5_EUMVA|nr:hypothetical protein EVAR_68618_1 [Eumeta japonica]